MQNPRGVPSAALFSFRPRCSRGCDPLSLLCFQQLAASFSLFALFLHTRAFVFRDLQPLLPKHRGYRGGQRGRGRNGGRAVNGRGRMRNRGPSGGGTLRRESPQQGQRPSSQNARVASARSQWPRASHCGLMHCTVKPGRNCILFFLAAGALFAAPAEWRGPEFPYDGRMLARILAQGCSAVKREYHNILWPGCRTVGTFDVKQSRKQETPARVVDDRGGARGVGLQEAARGRQSW